MGPVIQRVELLLQQSRYTDARDLLQQHLNENPQDFLGRYYLAAVYLQLGDKKQCRQMVEALLMEEPDNYLVLSLAVEMELADDLHEAAEARARLLVDNFPEDSDAFTKLARVKMGQRSYDKALAFTDKALELDAENTAALNLKIMLGRLLGKPGTQEAIDEALNLDPNSAYTIANQGLQLIRDGKVDEALERLEYALSLDPTNDMARYAMSEAMKARFWPYRMFLKYGEFTARLSEGGSWKFLIGVYIGYRLLRKLAESNETLGLVLWPLVFLLAFLFLLSWVLEPLMNFYLLSNPYGKLLLDEDDKWMARLTGSSFLLGLVAVAFYFGTGLELWIGFMMVFFGMMIPLGTFMKPNREKTRKYLKIFVIGVGATGLLGLIPGLGYLMFGFLIAIIGYQWAINGIMIKENARVFE